jgi:hypothetical protein
VSIWEPHPSLLMLIITAEHKGYDMNGWHHLLKLEEGIFIVRGEINRFGKVIAEYFGRKSAALGHMPNQPTGWRHLGRTNRRPLDYSQNCTQYSGHRRGIGRPNRPSGTGSGPAGFAKNSQNDSFLFMAFSPLFCVMVYGW